MSQQQLQERYRGEDEDYVFVENLRGERSVYRHVASGIPYRFEANGYAGSVVEVPARIARDPYIRRAEQRGHVRFLKTDEALDRMDQLVIRQDEESNEKDLILEAMDKGAMDSLGSRYKNKNLLDTGRETGEILPNQTWGDGPAEKGVRRHGAEKPLEPSKIDVTTPVPPSDALSEPVREGEWTTDTR